MIAKDGRIAATTSRDHKIRVWTLPDARLIQTIDLSERQPAVTALSDDGGRILVADYSGDLTIWDSRSREVRFQEHLDHYPLAATFSHDGRFVAIAVGSAPVLIFDLQSKRVALKLGDTPAGTVAIAFSHDNGSIATADGDGVVRVYDARSGRLLSENSDFLMEPLALDFTPDAKHLVAAGADKRLMFIDATTGKTLRRSTPTVDAIFYLEVSPNGRNVAVVTLNANNLGLPAPVFVFDLHSFEKKKEWSPPNGVIGGTWTANGHLIAATTSAEGLHLVTVE